MYRKAMTAFEIAGQAVKTSNRESESELQRTKDGNAQFSLCCTSTVMPDDDSQDRHPAFCFRYGNRKQESNKRFGDVACASGLARKSSLSPTSSRRQPKRPVPYAQTSAKCSARDTAPRSPAPYIVPGRKTHRGSH